MVDTAESSNSQLQDLLEGSGHYNGTLASWTKARRYISSAIHRSGTILDIGCGNGLLLACLRKWSSNRLEPYGVDIDSLRIKRAAELLPSRVDRFAAMSSGSLQLLRPHGLPETYDFVYWNVGDNVRFETAGEFSRVQAALLPVRRGGRLILGFYDKSAQARQSKIRNLAEFGLNIRGKISNAAGTKQAIWVERETNEHTLLRWV